MRRRFSAVFGNKPSSVLPPTDSLALTLDWAQEFVLLAMEKATKQIWRIGEARKNWGQTKTASREACAESSASAHTKIPPACLGSAKEKGKRRVIDKSSKHPARLARRLFAQMKSTPAPSSGNYPFTTAISHTGSM
jgi:hypothetical protein